MKSIEKFNKMVKSVNEERGVLMLVLHWCCKDIAGGGNGKDKDKNLH